MRYRISHTTEYAYSDMASLSQNELFLHPRETASQHVLESRVSIQPEPQYLQKWVDFYGNIVQVFMVQHPHKILKMDAVSLVETFEKTCSAAGEYPCLGGNRNPPLLSPSAGRTGGVPVRLSKPYDRRHPGHSQLWGSVLYTGRSGPAGCPAPDEPDFYRVYLRQGRDKRRYTGMSRFSWRKKGVCQDFSHLMISCLRSLGLAARYVSGYLETKPPPGKKKTCRIRCISRMGSRSTSPISAG